jgi:gentisate 1,2-dioxygenase
MAPTPAETPRCKWFYDRIDKQNMTALWSVLNAPIAPEPKGQCVPAPWRFDDIPTAMLEAGAWIMQRHCVARRRTRRIVFRLHKQVLGIPEDEIEP